MDIISFLLGLLLIINYQLALTYIGVHVKFRSIIIPSLFFAITAYISKIIFNAPPILHTVIIVTSCTLILHFLNKIAIILSFIGSLLSIITLIIGSLLLVCPLLIKIGIKIPHETSGIQWIFLNLAEFSIPLLLLFIFKVFKISPKFNL